MAEEQLTDYTQGLSVLYVEDDPTSSALLNKMLEPYFTVTYAAANGVEGLQRFAELRPDIIITDLMMPLLDGIDMIRAVRETDRQIPVILITASLEHFHLVDAINLGVSKFLAKPLRRDALTAALLSVCREMAMQRVVREARRQEMELLRLKERYHTRQEELARRKEQHIVRDRLHGKYTSDSHLGSWVTDLVHRPKDIMSGDSYAIRSMPDNTVQIFLADAMGHGLSASVTSMLATAFYNHINDGCACNSAGFDHMALRTILYAGRTLLEDEVFSASILHIDPARQIARFVSCGMPPLRIVRDGVVEKIKGKNPPVSAFTDDIAIQDFSLAGVSDILIATDGLGEAATPEGLMYGECLHDDLLATSTAQELFNAFQNRGCSEHDDITVIRVSGTGKTATSARSSFTAPGTSAGILTLQQQLIGYLDEAGLSGERRESFILAVTEALQNAFEHGCLGMGNYKGQLIMDGEYDERVALLEQTSRGSIEAIITCTVITDSVRLWLEIIDPGNGFTPQKLVRDDAAPCGRGLKVMNRSLDMVRHNETGNRILLMQTINREI
jgi:CheY-like chemotaxis protein/anti-sigma regulatory factor (Ser/Thr protein kinase)